MKQITLLILLLGLYCCTAIPDSSIHYLDKNKPDSIPQIFAQGIVSLKNRFETGITISPDGNSLAFGVAHESDPNQTAIYLMNFGNKKWSNPTKNFLSDNRNTFFPMFGPDGNELYFVKSTDNSETDIWVAEYNDNIAVNQRLLSPVINSSFREAGHGKSNNGSFYFTSNRADKDHCCGDIFRSEIDTVHKIDELNTVADEESIFLSKNEDYIIIQSWKNEYQSKHDLYISYRNKAGKWSIPERLPAAVNSNEIEQRPFITPDHKYLFFGRMTGIRENNKDSYESDIYWVSTKSIFKPYLYNVPSKIELTYNKPFSIQLPKDLFKDVDDHKLAYSVSLTGKEELPEWIKFNAETLILNGEWRDKKHQSLIITAIDGYKNKTSIKIVVKQGF